MYVLPSAHDLFENLPIELSLQKHLKENGLLSPANKT
jgi:hypothetical protein